MSHKTIRHLSAPVNFKAPAGEVNLADFWRARDGLSFSNSFNELILKASTLCTVSVQEATEAYVDLAEQANEAEISVEFPEEYTAPHLGTFLTRLALKLHAQWEGADGLLLINHH